MKSRLIASLILLSLANPAFAHRLDEYLQATMISLEKDRVAAQIRLTPGVAVFPIVIATIDTDHDGVISKAEQRAYAERVLADLSLSIDGDRLRLQLISAVFPKVEEMREGLGDIQVDFAASVHVYGNRHTLVFENHHLNPIATYLVNCLAPSRPDFQVVSQSRNYEQSHYQLEYSRNGIRTGPWSLTWWPGGRAWLGFVGVVLLLRLAVLRRRHHLFNTAHSINRFKSTSVR